MQGQSGGMEARSEVFLAAPYRTALNTRTLAVASATEQVAELLRQAVSQTGGIATAEPAYQWSTSEAPSTDSELRYGTLDDDLVPMSARPLLTLHLNQGFLSGEAAVPPESRKHFRILSAHAEYYDSTIAVLWIRAVVDNDRLEHDLMDAMDRRTTDLCARIVGAVQPLEFEMLSKLRSLAKELKCSELFLDDSESVVFADAPFVVGQRDAHSRLLWTSRVIHVAEIEQTDARAALEKWAGQSLDAGRAVSVSSNQLYPMYGNSVSVGPRPDLLSETLVRTWLPLLAGYALQDVLGASLRELFLTVSSSKYMSSSLMAKVDKTVSFLSYSRIEYYEFTHGLQGVRRSAAFTFLREWQFEERSQLLDKRQSALLGAVSSAVEARNRRYATLVEAALALIGGTALLDLALSLLSFARSGAAEEDSVPGLVDIAQWAGADLSLYVIMVGLGLLLLLVVRSRK